MKAVIFDCDGVLVDSEVIYKTSERMFLEGVGLTYDPAEFLRRFMGRSEDSFFEEIDRDHQALHGRPLPANFRPDLISHQKAHFETSLQSVAGMESVLQTMGDIPFAVASSSPTDSLRRKLAMTNLLSYFGDHVYSAQQVKHGKPAPDLFLFTAEKLGIFPSDCLVIEDSENGVLAGIAAGMTVWGFTGGGHCHDTHHESLREAGAVDVFCDAQSLGVAIQSLFLIMSDKRIA